MSDSKSDKLVKDHPLEMPVEGGPLAHYKGARPPAPKWFEEAVSTPYETHYCESDGARIHYQRWGNKKKPGLLLVHGNGAHAHWWDFIAPYFADKYNVAAMTFSGMGDSDRRDSYDMEHFAREEMAVCEAAGMFDVETPPIIVAHSFGGFVTLLTGAVYGDRLTGTIIVDSPVNPPDKQRMRARLEVRPNRVYNSLEQALGRFRLAPQQPCENDYIMDYIARWSLTKIPSPSDDNSSEGWTWKFDPNIWRRFNLPKDPSELLKATKCRIALFRGDLSVLMPESVGEYMEELLDRQIAMISIPHARHHVWIDQPLPFISALRTLLDEWKHSSPHRQTEGS